MSSTLTYISCFSGIGGLEGSVPPTLLCELNEACREVLRARFPDSVIHGDILTLKPPKADLVAGGWPCQDVSVAGRQAGLSGDRSGLLTELLRVAKVAEAKVVIAENVSNLLRMRDGKEFHEALSNFHDAGFPFVTWRLLNAREFGLPQHRTRLLIVASKDLDAATSLFRPTPDLPQSCLKEEKRHKASGFYWTAGTHSINYSRGYVPTLKIGSTLNIPSPPAVHYGTIVRQLSSIEALRLQGFEDSFDGIASADLHRMAGNAVPRPMGSWVFDGVVERLRPVDRPTTVNRQLSLFDDELVRFSTAGISIKGSIDNLRIEHQAKKAVNLIDFINTKSKERLSSRAANGLLGRLNKSGQACPEDLREILERYAIQKDD